MGGTARNMTVRLLGEDVSASKSIEGLGKAAGALTGGLGVASAALESLSVNASSAKLAAQLDLAGPAAEAAGQKAKDLFVGAYAGSVEEAGEITRLVAQNIADLNDVSFDEIAQSVSNLAAVFDQDLAATTAAVGQLMKTGLAKDGKQALDQLTSGFTHGVDKAGDLLDTVTEYSTQFRQLGLTAEDAFGLMQQGLQAGARDSDTVADSLKELAIRAQDGSDTTSAAFEQLGLDARVSMQRVAEGGAGARDVLGQVFDRLREMPASVEKTQIQVGLFGTKSEDLQKALGALDLTTAAAGLGQVEGAAARTNETMDTGAARFDAFKNKMQLALVEKTGEAITLIGRLSGFLEDNKEVAGAMAGVYLLGVTPALFATAGAGTAAMVSLNLMAASAARAAVAAAPLLAVTAVVGGTVMAWKRGKDEAAAFAQNLDQLSNASVTNVQEFEAAHSKLKQLADGYADAAAKNGMFGGAADKTQAALEKLEARQASTNDMATALAANFSLSREELDRLAKAANVDLGTLTFDEARAAIVKYREGAATAGTAAGKLSDAQVVLKDTVASAKEKVDALKVSFDAFYGVALDASSANDNYEASLDAVTESLKANGRTLDAGSEKGRANRQVVRDIMEATRRKAQAQLDAGGTQRQYNATVEAGKEAARSAAQALGGQTQATKDLVREIKLAPPVKKITISADTALAQARVNGLVTSMSYINDKRVKVTVDVSVPDIYSDLANGIDPRNIPDAFRLTAANPRARTPSLRSSGARDFAAGGSLRGAPVIALSVSGVMASSMAEFASGLAPALRRELAETGGRGASARGA